MIRPFVLFSLIFSFLMTFSACSEDDTDITGVYKIQSFGTSECDDPLNNFTLDLSGSDGCDSVLGIEVCGEGTLTLNADNTYALTLSLSFDGDSDTLTEVGEYSIEGNTITICEDGNCETSSFDASSGRISISFDDGTCLLTITAQK